MQIEKMCNIYKVLSDPTRLSIIKMLQETGSVCVCKVSEQFNLTQPTLSYHMALLVSAELVCCEKIGKFKHYRCNESTITALKEFI